MTGEPHTSSYYAATRNDPTERPALQGDVAADVCVVGGGFTGVSTALNLAERGYDVVLLEANRIGWGASGRNGGLVCSGYSAGFAVTALMKAWSLLAVRNSDLLYIWHD